jgi:hypothetical protein
MRFENHAVCIENRGNQGLRIVGKRECGRIRLRDYAQPALRVVGIRQSQSHVGSDARHEETGAASIPKIKVARGRVRHRHQAIRAVIRQLCGVAVLNCRCSPF